MKLLLTSRGLNNRSIQNALAGHARQAIEELSALCSRPRDAVILSAGRCRRWSLITYITAKAIAAALPTASRYETSGGRDLDNPPASMAR